VKIIRSEPEWHCIRLGIRGREPSHAEKVATIINVHELKGYMLQLHKDGRLDDAAKTAIGKRLADLEALYGRKLG
jgi:hypothetical protein